VLLVLALISCSTQDKKTDDPETITKDDAFRASIKGGQFAKLSAGYTYYEYANPESDTVIVMVHGFSVPSYIWDSTYYAAAKRGYGALRYDTYGRGYSDNPEAVYDIAMAAQQLKELLDALNIHKKVNLLGLSYGGTTISAFAFQYPEQVRNLIYVDAAGFETVTDTVAHPILVSEEEVQAFKAGDNYAGMAKGQLSDFYDSIPFKGWDRRYQEMMRFKGFVRALISTRKNRTSIEIEQRRIAASGIPVFAMWGEFDQVVKLEEVKSNMMDRFPKIELFVIPKTGHLPHMEAAGMFNSILFDQIICCPR
jgi:pimeloyl-ACP methyl ester carboxylesterase